MRGCWKEIAAALPWRTSTSVYFRAHVVCNRAEERIWTAEERQLILNFHKENGSKWRTLADALGENRIHNKDAFRRNKLPNLKKGRWFQRVYQTLLDLVNMELRMRAFEERKIKHGMLREAISWEVISEKLSARSHCSCATKWYDQLTSPMSGPAKKKGPKPRMGPYGIWSDTDDYRLIDALLSLDASCIEDVDWDSLLELRCGDLC